MRHPRAILVLASLLFTLTSPAQAADLSPAPSAVKVIFDTDMSGDVDDCGALAILHALADLGEAKIMACVVNGRDADNAAVAAVTAINAYYGRADLAVGAYHGKLGGVSKSKYTATIRDEFPHAAPADDKAPDALTVYRQALAGAPDGSVVIISVGFLMNLEELLDSKADDISPLSGTELVQKKVRRLVVMGGQFPNPKAYKEYNFAAGGIGPCTQRVVANWPTPILFDGFSIGQGIITGKALTATPADNPVRRAYELYGNALKNGRSSWDPTAVLAAVRDPRKYWDVSAEGCCTVEKSGANEWSATPNRGHSYLVPKIDNAEMAKILDELMTRPPGKR